MRYTLTKEPLNKQKEGDSIMAIHLAPRLIEIKGFKDMKDYADESLREFGLEEYRVNIRLSTQEEEYNLLTADQSIFTDFNPETRTMEMIIGNGYLLSFDKYKELAPNISDSILLDFLLEQSLLDDPKEFAQIQVIDTLSMYISNYEED